MKFEGCYTALVTPFQKNGQIDETAFRRLIRHQITGKAAGLVPCGSTGEAATLTHGEYRRLIELCLEESHGRIPVIAGVGTNATWKAVELAREAQSVGADAVLLLAPYYNKPTQEGLFAHFSIVARSLSVPIMLYNIPGRTAVNVAPATINRLARAHQNILAVKEAAGSLDQVTEILVGAPKSLTVLSGDDSLTLPMMSVGARGVVSVLSNLIPKQVAGLCSLFLSGKAAQAAKAHLALYPLTKALFCETNPIPVKAALELMGFCRAEPRMPLTPLTSPNKALLRKRLKEAGLL